MILNTVIYLNICTVTFNFYKLNEIVCRPTH